LATGGAGRGQRQELDLTPAKGRPDGHQHEQESGDEVGRTGGHPRAIGGFLRGSLEGAVVERWILKRHVILP
jgi:hypothetical protein